MTLINSMLDRPLQADNRNVNRDHLELLMSYIVSFVSRNHPEEKLQAHSLALKTSLATCRAWNKNGSHSDRRPATNAQRQVVGFVGNYELSAAHRMESLRSWKEAVNPLNVFSE